MKILTIGKGKLTYALSIIGIVWAIAGYFLGYLEMAEASKIVFACLTVFGIRRAIQ